MPWESTIKTNYIYINTNLIFSLLPFILFFANYKNHQTHEHPFERIKWHNSLKSAPSFFYDITCIIYIYIKRRKQ